MSEIRTKLTNIHGARSTDALPARPPECQTGIHLILDLDQRIQDHGSTVVEVNLVVLHLGLGPGLFWIPSVDGEGLLLLRPQTPGALLLSLGGRRGGGSPGNNSNRKV